MTKSYDFDIKKVQFRASWTFSIWYNPISQWSRWKVLFKIWETTKYEKQYACNTTSFSDNQTYSEEIPANTTLEVDLQAHAEYTDAWASVSWTWYITYWKQLISYKKIKSYELKPIGKKATAILFGRLPTGEWRNGN